MLRSWLVLLVMVPVLTLGQRVYRPSSVLSTGSWFKIAVKDPGIYKVDLSLLNSLGMNTASIPSLSIRLFGNGGQMLPESPSGNITDDLKENAIEVNDGGDGVFNGTDYFLFYADGPDTWLKDSVNKRFAHSKNLYTDQSFYFITIEGTGKRITAVNNSFLPGKTITSFNERYFHELDSINFLSSGKNWYGEEFANGQGKSPNRNFILPLMNIANNEPGIIISNCIARSIGNKSNFSVDINNVPVLQHDVPATGSSNLDVYAVASKISGSFIPLSSLAVTYKYQSQSPGAQGWLDWFELFYTKNLSLAGTNQLMFRDWNSVAPGTAGEFVLQGANSGTSVWDITDGTSPLKIKLSNDSKFINDCNYLHEYIAFTNTGFLIPSAVGKVNNQNLHNSSPIDLLVITHQAVVEQARRLASYHNLKDNMKVLVVTAEEVYNEFASGSPDPTAIRDFVKMYYDKAGNDTASRPKYLLLFGDASYDYKDRLQNNTNLVPAYQSNASLDPLSTYTSDDYFGFLNDNENINSGALINTLDIGIGRVPAKTQAEAAAYVDKLIEYTSAQSLGPWRNNLTFIADDEDFNLHLHDAEIVAAAAALTNSVFLQNKVYLDAFPQESNASGSRYPAVNTAINNYMQNGTLIWNYSGHGSFRRLAEEVVLDQDIVNGWNNPNKLPLFITATCDFAPYDNPGINSLGENILLRQKTGAIALMTTTRLVFAFSNRIMNRNYLLTALRQKSDGSYQSLGEAVRTAKNITYQSMGDMVNNLKFTLLGDPALTLAFPKYKIQTNTINGISANGSPDTLKALASYEINGAVTDVMGNELNGFNGTVYSTIYDKATLEPTLANDPESIKENIQVQRNILFKGKSSVKNGRFVFKFVVPKDIGYQFGNGKISYYAEDGKVDANGSFTNLIIGGSQGISSDNNGPEIKAFLDDEQFINGNSTGQAPLLILKLADTSGINITGTAIGHDIMVMVDDDPKKVYVLNELFEPEFNSFQKGAINFRLPILEEGVHTLKAKAWDVANNSSEITIRFKVVKNRSFNISGLFSFPNPFRLKTTFRFRHDLEPQSIQVFLSIFTVSGKLVKSIRETINTDANRSCDIIWDGKNDIGAGIQSGIYIYRLKVISADGVKAEKAGKIVKFL